MIEDTLDGAKSKRYRHAARHLAECQSLASLIGDYGGFESHTAFVARLRGKHSRKVGFWALVVMPPCRSVTSGLAVGLTPWRYLLRYHQGA
jgi:Family of unknown function (DUF6880)